MNWKLETNDLWAELIVDALLVGSVTYVTWRWLHKWEACVVVAWFQLYFMDIKDKCAAILRK